MNLAPTPPPPPPTPPPPPPTPPPTNKMRVPSFREFFLGGIAAITACLFTNPIEVVKTRMQLQGELEAHSTMRVYKNPFQAFFLIAQKEGLKGIQKGLFPACLHQFTMNGTRLGSYSVLQYLLGNDSENQYFFLKNVFAGATAGVIGASIGSPFFLVKIRMQSQSEVFSHVGKQYHYKNTFSALSTVWKEEGIKGLYKGVDASALRVAAGSSVQLSTYDQSKKLILSTGLFTDSAPLHIAASLVSGLLVTTAMNPFDVVSTRMYNENSQGAVYRNPFDCLAKTVRAEGFRGLYKGFTAHYLRLGPHTVLTLLFWEQLKKLARWYDAREK